MTIQNLTQNIIDRLNSMEDLNNDVIYDVTCQMAFASGLFDETDDQWYAMYKNICANVKQISEAGI